MLNYQGPDYTEEDSAVISYIGPLRAPLLLKNIL